MLHRDLLAKPYSEGEIKPLKDQLDWLKSMCQPEKPNQFYDHAKKKWSDFQATTVEDGREKQLRQLSAQKDYEALQGEINNLIIEHIQDGLGELKRGNFEIGAGGSVLSFNTLIQRHLFAHMTDSTKKSMEDFRRDVQDLFEEKQRGLLPALQNGDVRRAISDLGDLLAKDTPLARPACFVFWALP